MSGVSKIGIKETLEVFDFVKVMVENWSEARKDGKITLLDLPKFAPAIPAGHKAFVGSDKIVLEIKDLDADEAQQILSKAFAIVSVIAPAVLGK